MKWQCWSGAQNTFFISDEWTESWSNTGRSPAEIAKKMCQSLPNFAVDGVIFLRKHNSLDFEWEFYNSDGSSAEMCGNAARCVAGYYSAVISKKDRIEFKSLAGNIVTSDLGHQEYRVQMTPIMKIENESAHKIYNTGVPHLVVDSNPDGLLAKSLRFTGGGAGVNVTFVKPLTESRCEGVTFERGVENFTKACGTGAVACAMYMHEKFGVSQAEVIMPGGRLVVENIGIGLRPYLSGEAHRIFDVEFEL